MWEIKKAFNGGNNVTQRFYLNANLKASLTLQTLDYVNDFEYANLQNFTGKNTRNCWYYNVIKYYLNAILTQANKYFYSNIMK